MSGLIVDTIRDHLTGFLPSLELDLFDIQFRREAHGWVLRVFIDSPTGVGLDDCSRVSRELGYYLDVEDIIDHTYNLEVSSPGLERPLRSVDDFKRFSGKKAKVKFHQPIHGEKTFEGVIELPDGVDLFLKIDDGTMLKFSYDMLSKARLVI
jgi:ribosome maturation factor RimP